MREASVRVDPLALAERWKGLQLSGPSVVRHHDHAAAAAKAHGELPVVVPLAL